MENQSNDVISEVNRDLSYEWIDLGNRVRDRFGEIQAKAAGTPIEADLAQLNNDTSRICDHLERIHHDVARLLVELEVNPPEMSHGTDNIDPEELQREAIKIQRENHELRADFKDILKALFMWQDDPKERVKGKEPAK